MPCITYKLIYHGNIVINLTMHIFERKIFNLQALSLKECIISKKSRFICIILREISVIKNLVAVNTIYI